MAPSTRSVLFEALSFSANFSLQLPQYLAAGVRVTQAEGFQLPKEMFNENYGWIRG